MITKSISPARGHIELERRPTRSILSGLRLRQLALLDALGESGNLRQAAQALYLAQPAATRMLKALEALLAVPLFERSRQGMTPTIAGHAMIRHARVMLADLDSARTEVAALASGHEGDVRIGTVTSTGLALLPRAIARIAAARPLIRVKVIEGSHELLASQLDRGQLDFMLGRAYLAQSHRRLRYEALYAEVFQVVCGVTHRLARRRRVRLADLLQERWILPPVGAWLRQRLEVHFANAGARPICAVESVSILTNQALVRETQMIAILPADVAAKAERLGELRVLRLDLPDLEAPVSLVCREGIAPTPAARALQDALRALATR